MSVETQISRIKANIASAYAKAAEKGAELPAVQSSENLPGTIEGIPAGGLPEGVHTITVAADPPEDGIVSGGGVASEGMTVTVTASPSSGFEFVEREWCDCQHQRLLFLHSQRRPQPNGGIFGGYPHLHHLRLHRPRWERNRHRGWSIPEGRDRHPCGRRRRWVRVQRMAGKWADGQHRGNLYLYSYSSQDVDGGI